MSTGEVEYQDEKPDEDRADDEWDGDVWIGGGDKVDGEQFIEALEAVVELQDSLQQVRGEIEALDTGLDREDTIRLMKGRNLGMALDDIEAFFDAIDAVIESEPQEIAPRLIQSKVSGLTIEEAAEFFGEMVTLAEKYGSLNTQTEDDNS